jgi:hypothetical protein
VLYPAFAKGAHERKVTIPKRVSAVNRTCEEPRTSPRDLFQRVNPGVAQQPATAIQVNRIFFSFRKAANA